MRLTKTESRAKIWLMKYTLKATHPHPSLVAMGCDSVFVLAPTVTAAGIGGTILYVLPSLVKEKLVALLMVFFFFFWGGGGGGGGQKTVCLIEWDLLQWRIQRGFPRLLFHFYWIFKKNEINSAKRTPHLYTYEPPFQKSCIRPCITFKVDIHSMKKCVVFTSWRYNFSRISLFQCQALMSLEM